DDADWGVTMASVYDWLVPRPVRTGLYLLLGSAALVLLIACTNIANLTLARAALRRREQAVRLALGASRIRVVREVLTESVLLAFVGGVIGLGLAYWIMPVFRRQLTTVLPRAGDIALSAPVLAFALLASLATGLLFGALPAFLNSSRDVLSALKADGRSGARQGIARRLLVVGQLALATILLAGVAPVGVTSGAPFAGGNTGQPVRAQGANALGNESLQADWRMVSPGYFNAMGIPILRGRSFTEEDRRGGPGVVILSADAARRFWPNEDPI